MTGFGSRTRTRTRTATRTATAAIWLLALTGCPKKAASPAPAPATKTVEAPAPAPKANAPEPSVADEELVEEAPEANPTSETVKIKLVADEKRKARVFWGRKDLGLAPLELERPRGSGPLDLVVIAPGALPLHTRVFTDRDDKLALRLYSEAEAPNILGYRPPEEAPPGGKPARGKSK